MQTLIYLVDGSPGTLSALDQRAAKIDWLVPTGYELDKSLRLSGQLPPGVADVARRHDVPLLPLLKNADFDPKLLHAFLTAPRKREALLRDLVSTARAQRFEGWHFDFEHIFIADRDAYTDFVREAGNALRAAGLGFSVAVVPSPATPTVDDPYHQWLDAEWRAAYDVAAIAAACDFVVYMTYDNHTSRTPPGPIAALPWMRSCLDHLEALRVLPDRIFLGVPFFGRYWLAQKVLALTHAQSERLLGDVGASPRFDPGECTMEAVWRRGHVREYLFYEDARTFGLRVSLAYLRGFRGIAAWRLGMEDPAIWSALVESSRARPGVKARTSRENDLALDR